MSIDVRLEGDFSIGGLLAACGLQDGGPVQAAVDRAVINYSKPYWAWDTGQLANSANDCIGTGRLEYYRASDDGEYEWIARDMYYGVRQNGETFNYHKDVNPLAGPFPVERMVADHLNDILEEARQSARHQ